jgi:hypothetical protein
VGHLDLWSFCDSDRFTGFVNLSFEETSNAQDVLTALPIAMITATFSLIQQLMSQKCFPAIRINYTSNFTAGQVYIPAVNWICESCYTQSETRETCINARAVWES